MNARRGVGLVVAAAVSGAVGASPAHGQTQPPPSLQAPEHPRPSFYLGGGLFRLGDPPEGGEGAAFEHGTLVLGFRAYERLAPRVGLDLFFESIMHDWGAMHDYYEWYGQEDEYALARFMLLITVGWPLGPFAGTSYQTGLGLAARTGDGPVAGWVAAGARLLFIVPYQDGSWPLDVAWGGYAAAGGDFGQVSLSVRASFGPGTDIHLPSGSLRENVTLTAVIEARK